MPGRIAAGPLWVSETKRLGVGVQIDNHTHVAWVTEAALHAMGCTKLPPDLGVMVRREDWLPIVAQCRAVIDAVARRKFAAGKFMNTGDILIEATDVLPAKRG